jgi:hypothetical protein
VLILQKKKRKKNFSELFNNTINYIVYLRVMTKALLKNCSLRKIQSLRKKVLQCHQYLQAQPIPTTVVHLTIAGA